MSEEHLNRTHVPDDFLPSDWVEAELSAKPLGELSKRELRQAHKVASAALKALEGTPSDPWGRVAHEAPVKVPPRGRISNILKFISPIQSGPSAKRYDLDVYSGAREILRDHIGRGIDLRVERNTLSHDSPVPDRLTVSIGHPSQKETPDDKQAA